MRTAVIHYDETTRKSSIQLSINGIDEGLEMMCEAIVVILRAAHRRGDNKNDTQKRLDNIKLTIWTGIVNKYDAPDVAEIPGAFPPTMNNPFQ